MVARASLIDAHRPRESIFNMTNALESQRGKELGATMSKGQSLQDPFLNALRKERIPVSIFLVSGIKLQGQIESFDQFVILLRNTVNQMIYKSAISTVVPSRAVSLDYDDPLETLD